MVSIKSHNLSSVHQSIISFTIGRVGFEQVIQEVESSILPRFYVSLPVDTLLYDLLPPTFRGNLNEIDSFYLYCLILLCGWRMHGKRVVSYTSDTSWKLLWVSLLEECRFLELGIHQCGLIYLKHYWKQESTATIKMGPNRFVWLV